MSELNQIQFHRLVTAGVAPTSAQVKEGAIVFNLADQRLYTKDHNGRVIVIADGVTEGVYLPLQGGGTVHGNTTINGDFKVNSSDGATNMMTLSAAEKIVNINGGITLKIGEGLHLLGDDNYFATSADARIMRMIDLNGVNGNVDGGLIIDAHTPTDNTTVELLRIRNNEFKWKGSTIWHAGNDGAGSGLDADLLDGVNSIQFLRNDVAVQSLSTNDNTTLSIVTTNDTKNAELRIHGAAQGTGRLYVGQSISHGGGIEYNGDNSPATVDENNSDYITLYRRTSGVDYWTARNYYSSNDWEFRAKVTAQTLNATSDIQINNTPLSQLFARQYSEQCVLTKDKWSRVAKITQGTGNNYGGAFTISIGYTRSSCVVQARFDVQFTHAGQYVSVIGHNTGYNSVQMRVLTHLGNDCYVEFFDSKAGVDFTTQTCSVDITPISDVTVELYDSFVDGTTLPTNYSVRRTVNSAADSQLTVNGGTVYHTSNKPSKSDVGLSNVPNYTITNSYTDASTSKFASAKAVKDGVDHAKAHTNQQVDLKVSKTGDTMTGALGTTTFNKVGDSGTLISIGTTANQYINWGAGNDAMRFTYGGSTAENETIVYGKLYENSVRVYSPNNKPSWEDVGGDTYFAINSDHITAQGRWIKAANNSVGFLPYSNNNSLIGTNTWRFKEAHVSTVYEGGTALGSKYLGISAKAVDSDKLDGLNSTDFSRSNHTHQELISGTTGTIDAAAMDSLPTRLRYYYNVTNESTNLFPCVNDANAILHISTHSSGYAHQLGFSENGHIYQRNKGGGSSVWTDWFALYTTRNKPNNSDVGLGNVHNYVITHSATEGSSTKYASGAAVKAAYDKAVAVEADLNTLTGGDLADLNQQLDTFKEVAQQVEQNIDLINNKLGKTETAADSAKLEGKTKAQVIAEAQSGLATDAALASHTSNTANPHNVTKVQVGLGSVNNWPTATSVTDGSSSKYASAAIVKNAYDLATTKVSKTGDTMTGDLVIQKSASKLTLNNTSYSSGLSRLEFLTHIGQNLYLEHEVTDPDNPQAMAGQTLYLRSTDANTHPAHFSANGELFAKGDKKVYHEGNKPTWADVGGNAYFTDTGYLRAQKWVQAGSTTTGFIPYSNGNSYLGTSTWKFKEAHAVTLYENGVALSAKYLGINAKAKDADKLDGLNSTDFSRSNHNHDNAYLPRHLQVQHATDQLSEINFVTRELATAKPRRFLDFADGQHPFGLYDNANSGAVTLSVEDEVFAPNNSVKAFTVHIDKTQGSPSPGDGGFHDSITSNTNKVFVQQFWAKLPVGVSLSTAANATGTGRQEYFVDGNQGTGKWRQYTVVRMCGHEGSFSSTGFIYTTSSLQQYSWSMAHYACYELTDPTLPYSKHNKPVASDLGFIADEGETYHDGIIRFTGEGATSGVQFLPKNSNDGFGIRSNNSDGNTGELEFYSTDDDQEPFVFRHYTTGFYGTGSSVEWFRIDNNNIYYRNQAVFHEGHAPTKSEVGLGSVNNWGASSAVNSTSTTTYATSKAVKDAYDRGSAGVNAAATKLPLAGGTMTGRLNLQANQIAVGTYAMEVNNSNIGGVHGIYFKDDSTDKTEGILFPKTGKSSASTNANDYTSFWIDGSGVAKIDDKAILHAGNIDFGRL